MIQKRYVLLAAVLTIALLYVSCMQHYRWEMYKDVTVEYEWGSIKASSLGDRREERGVKLRASPYDLHVTVIMNESVAGKIIVTNLELIDTAGKTAFSHPGPLQDSFRPDSVIAGIWLYRVDLPYVDYRLRCNVEIQLENETIHEVFDQPFETNLREWDNLFLPLPPA